MTTKKVAISGTMESQLLNKALKSKKIPGSTPTEIGKNYKIIKKKVGSNTDIMDKIDKIYKDTLQEYLEDEPPKVPLAKEKTGFKDLPRELQLKIIGKSGMYKTGFKDLPRELQMKIFAKADMVDMYPEINKIFEPIFELYDNCEIVFDAMADKVYEQNNEEYEDRYEAKVAIEENAYIFYDSDLDDLSTLVLPSREGPKQIKDFQKALMKETTLEKGRITEISNNIIKNINQNQRIIKEIGKRMLGNTTKMVSSLESPYNFQHNKIKTFVEQAMKAIPKKDRDTVIKVYAIIASSFAINYLLNENYWTYSSIGQRLYQKQGLEETWDYIVNEAMSKG